MASLVAVEVRSDPNAHAWYNACLEDATVAGIVCSFEDGVWPEETFPASDVRFQTPPRAGAELDAFEPALGDLVEMELPRTALAPSGWRRCRVKDRRRAFFFVAPTERLERGARGEVIVPQAKLRPVVPNRATVQGLLSKVKVPVDPLLSDWLTTTEAAASLERINHMCRGNERRAEEHGNAVREHLLKLKAAPSGEPSILLIGTASTVRHARSWVTMTLNYALWIKKCEEVTQRRDRALEDRERRARSAAGTFEFCKEFEADMAYVFGREGLGRHNLQARYGVSIEVLRGSSERKWIVRICGNVEANVQEALETAEQVEETLDVDPEKSWWVRGREDSTITDIAHDAGLWACSLDVDSAKLIFQGSRSACNQAKELFSAHMLYYETFVDMDGSLNELTVHLQNHETHELLKGCGDFFKALGKGKGRGRGKGKGKGGLDKGKGKGDFEKGIDNRKGKGKGKMPFASPVSH